jgi:predicted transcriptional regulator
MTSHRNTLEVFRDILETIAISSTKRGISKTHIMYKANLSMAMTNNYLKILFTKKFIIMQEIAQRKQIFMTLTGRETFTRLNEFVNEYRQFSKMFTLKGGNENDKKEN